MSTFHPFSRLPKELRLLIWEEANQALIPNVCTVRMKDWKIISTSPPPSVLSATQESRQVALKQQRSFHFGSHWTPQRVIIYLSPTTTILEIHLNFGPSTSCWPETWTSTGAWWMFQLLFYEALNATRNVHLRCQDLRWLRHFRDVLDVLDSLRGYTGHDEVYESRERGSRIITASIYSVSQINERALKWCYHEDSDQCRTLWPCEKRPHEFLAYRFVTKESFYTILKRKENPEIPMDDEKQLGIIPFNSKGVIELPISEEAIAEWDHKRAARFIKSD